MEATFKNCSAKPFKNGSSDATCRLTARPSLLAFQERKINQRKDRVQLKVNVFFRERRLLPDSNEQTRSEEIKGFRVLLTISLVFLSFKLSSPHPVFELESTSAGFEALTLARMRQWLYHQSRFIPQTAVAMESLRKLAIWLHIETRFEPRQSDSWFK